MPGVGLGPEASLENYNTNKIPALMEVLIQ